MATNLPTGKTAVAYSGTTVDYAITAAGVVLIKLWGGGGGSANYTGTNYLQNYGGSGGFVDFNVKVVAGDVLTVQVAQGGQSPVLSPASGGVGGYPDGGSGGSNGAVLYTQGAGGGGSTRVYLNGTLIAVAAGGGGGGGTSGTQQNSNNIIGAAGGLTAPAVSSAVLGGSQTAGGTNTFGAVSGQDGASLQGGNGFNTGFSTAQTNTASNAAGGGGGGGYFGGAGGGNYAYNSAAQPGACNGAGGSSWVASTSVVKQLRNVGGLGNHGTAPNYMDVDFAAGVGACGSPVSGTASRATAGGNGRAVLNFVTTTALSQGKQTLGATGNMVAYAITQPGIIRTKLWGAGGGGAITSGTVSTNARGSGGGFTSMDITVVAGDVLMFQVAGGGGPSSVNGTHLGGAGGYPDGGWGGYDTQSFYNGGGGGGGGSRVYLNGVLLGIAGGGAGGAGTGGGSGQGLPGAGGGINGGTNTAYAGIGAGGQSAGGGNTGDPTQSGSFLTGGNGFPYDFTNNGNYGGVGGNYGGGGGGGYYGGAGGGHVAVNSGAGGGGGSGFISPSSLVANGATSTPSAGSVTPAGTTDPDYPANVGVGGNGNANTTGTGVAGAGGAIVFDFILTLPVGTTTVPYTGQPLSWRAPSSGTVSFKVWGGGGGTHGVYNGGEYGGGGGMVTLAVSVVAGDIVQVWTASGGLAPINTRGGLGGWPDGGYGGFRADGSTSFGGGGGGGGSRVYINGTLAAVAGGGGGAFLNSQANPQMPGGGAGGLTGATGSFGGTGGSQSAGGVSPVSNAATNGALLKGGNGAIVAVTSPTANLGGGGGGGYYGGGGGYTTGSYTGGGGGGGSSYVASAFAGTNTAASGRLAPTDPDKPAGIGDGGFPVSGGNPAGQPGGNGYTVMTFTQTALPVNTGGPIGTINMLMNLIGEVVSTAVINIPPTDNDILVEIGGPPSFIAGVSLNPTIHAGESAIHLSPVSGYIPGRAAGDLGTDIEMSWQNFAFPMAETGPEAHPAATPVIAMGWAGPPTINASANAINWNPHDGNGNLLPGLAFVQVNMTRPDGTPSSGAPTVTPQDLPNSIVLTVPNVFAENGISVLAAINLKVTLNMLVTASETGAANAYGAPENPGDPDSRNWRIKQVQMLNAVLPQFNCGANFTELGNTGDMTVIMIQPLPVVESGAFILTSILPTKVVMKPTAGGAAMNNGAMAVGDLDGLTITMGVPSYTVITVPNIPDAILMEIVDGYVDLPPKAGFSKIKLKRSTTEKTVPPLLHMNEIALNEADGILYSRDGDGFVRHTPYLGFGEGRVVPLGGANGQVLSVFLDWRAPHYQTPSPLIEPMPTNTQLYLAGDVTSVGNVALRPTTTHNYVVYKPFFLQRPLTVTSLLAQQALPNLDGSGTGAQMSVWLGLAQWDRNFERPGTIYSVRKFDLADGGSAGNQLTYTLIQALEPGWYTTIFAYEGALDGVEFTAGQCGPFLRGDMIVQGNPYGVFDGGLFPAALPPSNHNYLPAAHLMDHVDLALVQATVGTQ